MIRHMTIYGVFEGHNYNRTNLVMGGLAWVIRVRRDSFSVIPHHHLVLFNEGRYG